MVRGGLEPSPEGGPSLRGLVRAACAGSSPGRGEWGQLVDPRGLPGGREVRRNGERSLPSSLSSGPAPSPRFTDEDEHVIQHCFHYTSTVLTSTLAFQKEQKLKCECQVSDLPCTSLRDGVAQLSAPESHLQGKSPCLCGRSVGRDYLGPPRPLIEASHRGGQWFLRTAAVGTVCDLPLVFNLGTAATSGRREPQVGMHMEQDSCAS